MPNNKKYFVEIEPIGYYFFGGERTFTTNEKDKYNDIVTNYFAESNKYPQQTALLGLLRHTLLTLYNRLNASFEDKTTLIGNNSFTPGYDGSYGLIESISPLVIYQKENEPGRYLYVKGIDNQAYYNHEFGFSNVPVLSFMNKHATETPVLEGYNYKNDLDTVWTDGIELVAENDIFKKPLIKVGVKINSTDDGFYKQTFQALQKHHSFGCWVTFKEALDDTKLQTILMPFGADQSTAKITFHSRIDNVFEQLNTGIRTVTKIVALSDAWIDQDSFNQINFGITNFTDFRFIKSVQSNYYNKVSENKSTRYGLLTRGSVLYCNSFLTELENSSLKRIGYNYFKHFS